MTENTKTVAECEHLIQRVKELLVLNQAENDRLNQKLRDAHKALADARIVEDEKLEKCTVVLMYGSRRDEQRPGVIVRRTKSAIFAKQIGEPDSVAKQYRKSRWGGWWQYPSASSMFGSNSKITGFEGEF